MSELSDFIMGWNFKYENGYEDKPCCMSTISEQGKNIRHPTWYHDGDMSVQFIDAYPTRGK